ncbi:MAG TPA: alpha/beta hydrolase [Candidatus Binatia bacterium]
MEGRRFSRRAVLRGLGVVAAVVVGTGVGRVVRRPGRVPRPAGARVVRRAYGSGPLQFGDLRVPDSAGPHAVALVVHGGFWLPGYDLDLMDPLCDALTAAGIATWNVEYRRIGEGGGYPDTFLDAAAGADLLATLATEFALDLARVVSVGHSAGGHLALWLAARPRISSGQLRPVRPPLVPRAALSLAGIADLALASSLGLGAVDRLMGGTPAQVPERYVSGSPAELLPLGVPQLLLHGRDDTIVPLQIAEGYHDAAVARSDRATLTVLDRIGHFELVDPASAAWPAVRDGVRSLLG